MVELQEYWKLDNCTIVEKLDDGKVLSWGVADCNMELVTSQSFRTAAEAFEFTKDYIGLCCD